MPDRTQKIVVFEENGSGGKKISGLKKYGRGLEISRGYNITDQLPELIDDPGQFISDDFQGDLVLSFLKHPDLNDHLARICRIRGIPLIASGKKISDAITPFTCCGLGKLQGLGNYGENFGFPELEIEMDDGRVTKVRVSRGASCGASWEAAEKILGLELEEALSTYAREVQYLCLADPSAFDPVSGKSSLHYAGDVHAAALRKAAKKKENG